MRNRGNEKTEEKRNPRTGNEKERKREGFKFSQIQYLTHVSAISRLSSPDILERDMKNTRKREGRKCGGNGRPKRFWLMYVQ
jgi:hypothetical protein